MRGVGVVTEECVYCGCGVEVGDAFGFEEAPDGRVVDFTEAVVGATDESDGPGEGPACFLFRPLV